MYLLRNHKDNMENSSRNILIKVSIMDKIVDEYYHSDKQYLRTGNSKFDDGCDWTTWIIWSMRRHYYSRQRMYHPPQVPEFSYSICNTYNA